MPQPVPSPREAVGRGQGWGVHMNARAPRKDERVPSARGLRRNMTAAERKLWNALRVAPIAGTHFRRQATIGPYFADFACHQTKLGIEVDGGSHGEKNQLAVDTRRTAFLNSQGYCVLRFWNNDVLSNVEGVMMTIHKAIEDQQHPTVAPHP